jgi:hypothetical protein
MLGLSAVAVAGAGCPPAWQASTGTPISTTRSTGGAATCIGPRIAAVPLLPPDAAARLNALIRAHHMTGGSVGHLVANAMDKPLHGAVPQRTGHQNEPTRREQWARGDPEGQDYLHSLRNDPTGPRARSPNPTRP